MFRHVVGFKQSVSFKEILRVAMLIFWNTRATSWASSPRREFSSYREFIIFLSSKPPINELDEENDVRNYVHAGVGARVSNPVDESSVRETVDPTIISDLEKQRALHRESEKLCVGHIKNSLSDQLYDLYTSVKDLIELWSALELKYKAHEEGTNKYIVSKYLEFQMADDKPIMEQVHELQVGAIIAKLPPLWKDFSKRMMHKYEDYSLDDMMKHLHIKEETRIKGKCGKVGSSVHHVSTGDSSHKTKSGRQNKRNLGPKNQSFKKPSHQNPNSNSKRVVPCHLYKEIGHYARECKDRKSGPVAHAVEQVTDMVASVNLGEIFMISSLTLAICARGLFVDTVHVCGQRESFRTYRSMPLGTVVVYVNGHRAEVQGRGDVRLKYTHGEWVTLQYVLYVPTISKGLVYADKFDKGGLKMELEKGTIMITNYRRYVRRANNCSWMYRLCLSDDGSSSGSSVDSNGASITKNGIKHERTSPYTPQHNGLAERKIKTLCEMVNCMLNQSDKPNNMGGGELLTACYVHNRITSRVIPRSPYELWKCRKPNLDYLKVWGCVAYYRTPDPKRTKLGARANKSIFIGYDYNNNAYQLLDIESGFVVESGDVEFFEDKFSRDDENSSHTTSTTIYREILHLLL
uniref:Integrase catalytic domain-containing protein n=1 Tax=Lactuca sativa TaxID=4236 RepID=A0A9R1VDL2_LACSA|nr:hypothetical protein LSAT_V11C500229490 [Lactuca sativa]